MILQKVDSKRVQAMLHKVLLSGIVVRIVVRYCCQNQTARKAKLALQWAS